MRIVILVLVSFFCLPALAQSPQEEINKQVWKVFIESYNAFDTEKFMSVYAKDAIRVATDEDRVFSFSDYKKNINREHQFNRNYRIKANIELRFIQRIHQGDLAYESGIYKISLTDNNGKPATLYSKFHVALKKEAGVWKIRYDSDSTEGGKISEKDFTAAKPM